MSEPTTIADMSATFRLEANSVVATAVCSGLTEEALIEHIRALWTKAKENLAIGVCPGCHCQHYRCACR